MSVQEIIRKRRIELDLTLKDVANALGVAEGTVSRYETGDIQNMGIDKIARLAQILRCSPGYLMGWEESPSVPQQIASQFSEQEQNLVIKFQTLNSVGKKKLLERADELLELGYVEKKG